MREGWRVLPVRPLARESNCVQGERCNDLACQFCRTLNSLLFALEQEPTIFRLLQISLGREPALSEVSYWSQRLRVVPSVEGPPQVLLYEPSSHNSHVALDDILNIWTPTPPASTSN